MQWSMRCSVCSAAALALKAAEHLGRTRTRTRPNPHACTARARHAAAHSSNAQWCATAAGGHSAPHTVATLKRAPGVTTPGRCLPANPPQTRAHATRAAARRAHLDTKLFPFGRLRVELFVVSELAHLPVLGLQAIAQPLRVDAARQAAADVALHAARRPLLTAASQPTVGPLSDCLDGAGGRRRSAYGARPGLRSQQPAPAPHHPRPCSSTSSCPCPWRCRTTSA